MTAREKETIFTVEPASFHAAGAAHGTLYFKMLDDAAFYAANSLIVAAIAAYALVGMGAIFAATGSSSIAVTPTAPAGRHRRATIARATATEVCNASA